ncbi:MAG: hypothetical protein AAFQ67_05100 [Pseudomonadota bacterium]
MTQSPVSKLAVAIALAILASAPVARAQDADAPNVAEILERSEARAKRHVETIIMDRGASTFAGAFSPNLVSPELVLKHAKKIGLSEAKRREIIEIAAKGEADVARLRLESVGRGDELEDLLAASPINANAAISELNRLMESEATLKRARLSMMVDVRNALTDAQFEELQDLRSKGPLTVRFASPDGFLSSTGRRGNGFVFHTETKDD